MTAKRYVFLSYGRKDVYPLGATNPVEQEQHFPIVEKVYYHLNGLKDTLKLEPWFDKRCLTHDRPFTDSIHQAIEQSDYLLLFIGVHSLNSEWCEREWKHALRYCVPIIPILLQGKWEDETVQKAYPSRILSTDGINPLRSDGTVDDNHLLTKIVDYVKQTPAPLAIAYNARTLPAHYIERPQYINDLKKRLGVNDINCKAVSNIVGITSTQETAALQGVGGIGKTTLALALCADCDVRRAFDHIFWLEAGPQTTKEDAPGLMRVIGAHFGDSPELYNDPQTARALLQKHLSGKRTLLVLDDVWHEGLKEQFSLAGIDLRLVVTTRQKRLVDDPETVDKLSPEEGLLLLATLFNPLNPDTSILTADHRAIVTTLDGYTLALEIAGKWLIENEQTPAYYLQRLRSSDAALLDNLQLSESDKNKNLELSLSLSYNALKPDDQRRFRALGIFASGSSFSLEALNAVWGMDDGRMEAQTLVKLGLVERNAFTPPPGPLPEYREGETKATGDATSTPTPPSGSRVQETPTPTLPRVQGRESDDTPRYTQHSLLRAYARALLTRAGETEGLFPRFADFYTQLADQFFELPPERWGALDDDLPNIHLTGDELVKQTDTGQSGDLQRALTFAYNTFTYLTRRRQVRHMEWTEMGLNAARALQTTASDKTLYRPSESLFLNELGGAWDALGEKLKAIDYHEQALPIRREVGDRRGEAITLNNIGLAWDALGEKLKALYYYELALPIRREVGDRGGEATTLNNIGLVWHRLGDKRKALEFYKRALLISREVGDRGSEAIILNNIGGVWDVLGNKHKALVYYKRALRIRHEVRDRIGEATTRSNMAFAYKSLGQRERTLAELCEAIAILKRYNLPYDASGASVEDYETVLRAWEGELPP